MNRRRRIAESTEAGSIRRASNGCLGKGRKAVWSSQSNSLLGAGFPRVRSARLARHARRSALSATRESTSAPAPEIPAANPTQPFDVPLLVGPPHQAEVFLKQIMALQPQKLFGQLPLASLEDLDHRDGRVVVADPLRHAGEVLEGPAMPFQKGLGAFARKRLNEDRSRVGQRHHEQGDLRLDAVQLHGGFAEINLSLARRMRQRQKDLLMHLLPGPYGILDDRVLAAELVSRPAAVRRFAWPYGVVSSEPAGRLQDLLNDGQELVDLRLRTRLRLR